MGVEVAAAKGRGGVQQGGGHRRRWRRGGQALPDFRPGQGELAGPPQVKKGQAQGFPGVGAGGRSARRGGGSGGQFKQRLRPVMGQVPGGHGGVGGPAHGLGHPGLGLEEAQMLVEFQHVFIIERFGPRDEQRLHFRRLAFGHGQAAAGGGLEQALVDLAGDAFVGTDPGVVVDGGQGRAVGVLAGDKPGGGQMFGEPGPAAALGRYASDEGQITASGGKGHEGSGLAAPGDPGRARRAGGGQGFGLTGLGGGGGAKEPDVMALPEEIEVRIVGPEKDRTGRGVRVGQDDPLAQVLVMDDAVRRLGQPGQELRQADDAGRRIEAGCGDAQPGEDRGQGRVDEADVTYPGGHGRGRFVPRPAGLGETFGRFAPFGRPAAVTGRAGCRLLSEMGPVRGRPRSVSPASSPGGQERAIAARPEARPSRPRTGADALPGKPVIRRFA